MAYRKGTTLAHIPPVQDANLHCTAFFAQLDEDKETYHFDRLSPEVQLLPLHLLGFPPMGYTMEWIAESLNNFIIITTTPFRPATSSFLCGIRQGSALACTTIANLVAWLTASIWVHMETPAQHPSLPPPADTPTVPAPNPIDIVTTDTLSKHSSCDDSSWYITAPDIPTLIQHIFHHHPSIWRHAHSHKNQHKCHQKLHPLIQSSPQHSTSFTYTAWYHGTRSVQSNPVPSVQMTPNTNPYKIFGTTLCSHDATISHTKAKIFPLLKHKGRLLSQHLVSNRTFSILYRAFVTSVASFNPICQCYILKAAISDDLLSLPLLHKQFGLFKAYDYDHMIYLTNMHLGHNFLGSHPPSSTIHLTAPSSLNSKQPALEPQSTHIHTALSLSHLTSLPMLLTKHPPQDSTSSTPKPHSSPLP